MHAFVTSKNVKWCHLIWPSLWVCKNLLKIPNCLGKMSENRRGFFWLTLYVRSDVQ